MSQDSHSIEKPRKSRKFFPGLEIGNSLENREISCKVGKNRSFNAAKIILINWKTSEA